MCSSDSRRRRSLRRRLVEISFGRVEMIFIQMAAIFHLLYFWECVILIITSPNYTLSCILILYIDFVY